MISYEHIRVKGGLTSNIKNQKANRKIKEALRAVIQTDPSTPVPSTLRLRSVPALLRIN
jgi:hypothetical protein